MPDETKRQPQEADPLAEIAAMLANSPPASAAEKPEDFHDDIVRRQLVEHGAPSAALDDVLKFIDKQNDAQRAFIQLSWTERLAVSDTFTLASHLIVGCCFAIWWQLLPPLPIIHLSLLVTPAYAQSAAAAPFDPKPWIYLGIFIALFVTFLVSLGVSYFSRSAKAAENASTVSKTLLGFFIGAATKFLGV